MDIWKEAAKAKLSVGTKRGNIMFYELYDLKVDELRSIGKELYAQVKSAQGEDDGWGSESPVNPQLLLRRDVVKSVYDDKVEEAKAKTAKATIDAQLSKVQAALDRHEDTKFDNLTEKQLKAQLVDLLKKKEGI